MIYPEPKQIIDELYDFRMIYHAMIFNEWTKQGLYDVHKSFRHHDGEKCFDSDDWFIVIAMLPTGQVSNRYHKKYWQFFKCPEEYCAKHPWNGHSSMDVTKRLIQLLKLSCK